MKIGDVEEESEMLDLNEAEACDKIVKKITGENLDDSLNDPDFEITVLMRKIGYR